MESPLHIGKDLRFDDLGTVRIEEPAQRFDHRLLFVSHPAGLHQPLQAVCQTVRTFDGERFHGGIIGGGGLGVKRQEDGKVATTQC